MEIFGSSKNTGLWIAAAGLVAGLLFFRRKDSAPASAAPSGLPSPPPPPSRATTPAPAPKPKSTIPPLPTRPVSESTDKRIERLERTRDVMLSAKLTWIKDPETGEEFTLAKVNAELDALKNPGKAKLDQLRVWRALLQASNKPYITDTTTGEQLTLAEVEKRIAALEKT